MEAAWRPGDELLLCTGATKPVVLAVLHVYTKITQSSDAGAERGTWQLRNYSYSYARVIYSTCRTPESGRRCPSPSVYGRARRPESCTNTTTATWLILPVVICLSKRLSHACLSMSIIQRDCERLIKTVMVYLMVSNYLDNRSNSRANTCTKGRLWSPVFIRLKPTTSGCFGES